MKTLGAATLALGTPAAGTEGAQSPAASAGPPVRFGVDMYSLGAQNWTPFQQMDFAAKWNVKVVHFSEIRFLGSRTGGRARSRQSQEGPRPRRRARARPRDRHALDLPDVVGVRQGRGYG